MNTHFPVSAIKKWLLLILVLASSVLTFSVSQKVRNQYYAIHAYNPDPISGLLKYAQLHHRLANESRWALAMEEFLTNPRDPFAIAPVVLIAPSLLTRTAPHLLIVFPCFVIFLFLMGYLILSRGHSFLFAASIIVCYSTSLVLFAGYFGLSFFLHDTIASYPLAIAAICLWLWHERRDKKNYYLVLFAAFVSITVLCRYAASVYAFIIFSPFLLYAFYSRLRESKDFFKAIGKPLLIAGSIILLLCGSFLLNNYQYNVSYYSYWLNLKGATMKVGVLYSLRTFLITYFGYFALFHSLLVLMMVFFGVTLFLKAERKEKYEYLLNYWFVIALPFYWIVLLQTDGQKLAGAFVMAFPLMYFGIFAGARTITHPGLKKAQTAIAWILLAVSLLSMPRTIGKCSKQAAVITGEENSYKRSTVALASYMVHNPLFSEQHTYVSDFAGDYFMTAASLEATYQWNVFFPFTSNGDYLDEFNRWDHPLNIDDLTIALKDSIFKKATTQTNVIITFDNRKNLEARFSSKELVEIASYVSNEMKNRQGWSKTDLATECGVLNIYMKQ